MTYLKIVTRFGFLGDKTAFHNWEFKRKKNGTKIREKCYDKGETRVL